MPKAFVSALSALFALTLTPVLAFAVEAPAPQPPVTPESKTPGEVDPNKPMGAIKIEDKPAVPPEALKAADREESSAEPPRKKQKHKRKHLKKQREQRKNETPEK